MCCVNIPNNLCMKGVRGTLRGGIGGGGVTLLCDKGKEKGQANRGVYLPHGSGNRETRKTLTFFGKHVQ